MLFMGQEWGASTPFLYFTDHKEELGRQVTEGRRKEFSRFPEFRDPAIARTIPDPQSSQTFMLSKLDWSEINHAPHRVLLELYRECLRLRASDAALRPLTRDGWEVLETRGTALLYKGAGCSWLILAHLSSSPEIAVLPEARWSLVLSSNETRFGGGGASDFDPAAGTVAFSGPELLILQTSP